MSGVVLNANTNQPVARALVQAGSHTMLTGQEGRFEFTDSAGTTASLRVTKPGFYDGLGPYPRSRSVTFKSPSEPWTIALYPEGLITGTVVAANGDPVANLPVQAWRRSEGEAGPAWNVLKQAMTDGEGEFRLPLPSGEYRIETQYQADEAGTHRTVLPLRVPDPGGNTTGAASEEVVHLASGAEQHLDLRPEVGPSQEVRVRTEGALPGGGTQLTAEMPNGLSFFLASRETGTPGELITRLPEGSYKLAMSSGDGDQQSYGEARVTIAGKSAAGTTLHLSRVPRVAVEVAVDPTSTSDNQLTSQALIQQLGLHFVRRGGQSTFGDDYGVVARGQISSVQLLPGRYKLMARPEETWFIESATLGGTDLTTQDLEVEQGGTSAPLRIVVSNHTGSLKGSVLLNGGPGSGCLIFVVAESPGVTPMFAIVSGTDGSFVRASIAPGSYRAVALEDRDSAELSDPATLERLSSRMKSFTVTAGSTANLEIDAIPAQELAH